MSACHHATTWLPVPGALFLYPFRARDPRTGKWYRARYLAERHVIAERYAEWEIIEPPEIRQPAGAAFNPFATAA